MLGKRVEVAFISRLRDLASTAGSAGISVGRESGKGRTAIMKKCEEVSKQLIAYLDRRANSADRHEVEEHLAACSACHQRAEDFRKLWGVLDEVPLVEPSLSFDARIRARIAEEPRRGWLGWLVPQPRLAFAMTLLLALCVLMVYLSHEGTAGGEPPEDLQGVGRARELRRADQVRCVFGSSGGCGARGPASAACESGERSAAHH